MACYRCRLKRGLLFEKCREHAVYLETSICASISDNEDKKFAWRQLLLLVDFLTVNESWLPFAKYSAKVGHGFVLEKQAEKSINRHK